MTTRYHTLTGGAASHYIEGIFCLEVALLSQGIWLENETVVRDSRGGYEIFDVVKEGDGIAVEVEDFEEPCIQRYVFSKEAALPVGRQRGCCIHDEGI